MGTAIDRIAEVSAELAAWGYTPTLHDDAQFYRWTIGRDDGSLVEVTYDGADQFDIADYDDANAYQVEDARITDTVKAFNGQKPADSFIRVIVG